jgi:transcriptional regulator with XRE-family HTH domain
MIVSEKDPAVSVKHEKAVLAKTTGNRMRQARELCGMGQKDAARRLGYKGSGSSRLNKIENCSDTLNIPNHIIVRAAKLYDVSTDFLFGLSDDWETDLPRENNTYLIELMEKLRLRDMAVLAQLEKKISTVSTAAEYAAAACIETQEALDAFQVLHPEFKKMRASRLVRNVSVGSEAAVGVRQALKRYRLECIASAGDSSQLSLELAR